MAATAWWRATWSPPARTGPPGPGASEDGTPSAVMTGDDTALTALAVPEGAQFVVTGGKDGTARIWSLPDGLQRHVLARPHGTRASHRMQLRRRLSWSPLARTARQGSGTLVDGSLRACLANHQGAVRTVAISPCDRWIVTGGDDRTIRVWDAQTGINTTTIRVDGRIMCCRWLPDGRQLCAGGYGGLYAFEHVFPAGESQPMPGAPHPIRTRGRLDGESVTNRIQLRLTLSRLGKSVLLCFPKWTQRGS